MTLQVHFIQCLDATKSRAQTLKSTFLAGNVSSTPLAGSTDTLAKSHTFSVPWFLHLSKPERSALARGGPGGGAVRTLLSGKPMSSRLWMGTGCAEREARFHRAVPGGLTPVTSATLTRCQAHSTSRALGYLALTVTR